MIVKMARDGYALLGVVVDTRWMRSGRWTVALTMQRSTRPLPRRRRVRMDDWEMGMHETSTALTMAIVSGGREEKRAVRFAYPRVRVGESFRTRRFQSTGSDMTSVRACLLTWDIFLFRRLKMKRPKPAIDTREYQESLRVDMV